MFETIQNFLEWAGVIGSGGVDFAIGMWIAAAAAIGAASGAAESGSEKKRQETEIQNRIDAVNAAEKARRRSTSQAVGGDFLGQYGLSDIFGEKPEAIQPPEVDESLSKNVAQIRNQGLPAALEFSDEINRDYADQTMDLNLARIRSFIPNFDEQTESLNQASASLLRGELPYDDVLDIVSDRSSLAASLGTPGGSAPATMRDLGMSRLSAITQGQDMFQSFANTLASAISPIPSYASGYDVLPYTSLSAQGRVQGELATTEAKQNAAIIEAMPDPAAFELFQQDYLATQNAAQMRAGTAVANTVGASALSGAAAGAQGAIMGGISSGALGS